MGVVADDEVDGAGVGGQRVRHLLLRRDDLVDVLVAPVQRHDDELGARRPGGSRVGEDQRRVDLVDEPLLAGRPHEPVEAVGVGQLGDARCRRRRRSPGTRPSGDRAVPAWARPAASSASSVATTPCSPKSSAWFDATEQPSKPASARSVASVARRAEARVARQRVLGPGEA